MPKRISTRPSDVNQAAFQMVQRSTESASESPIPKRKIPKAIRDVMSAMGKKGGKIGGKRSLITLTPEERRERALLAAKARWANRGK
jgi:hypothetical protein